MAANPTVQQQGPPAWWSQMPPSVPGLVATPPPAAPTQPNPPARPTATTPSLVTNAPLPDVTPQGVDGTTTLDLKGAAAAQAALESMHRHRALHITYTDDDGVKTGRFIVVYSVNEYRKYGAYYVHAYCGLRKAKRTFRCDRISWPSLGKKAIPEAKYQEWATLHPELAVVRDGEIARVQFP